MTTKDSLKSSQAAAASTLHTTTPTVVQTKHINNSIMTYVLFILAVLSAVIIGCSAFQQIPSTSNAVRSSSSYLGMAPRFDKTTEKWFPSNPEVCELVIFCIILQQIYSLIYCTYHICTLIKNRRKARKQDTISSAVYIVQVQCLQSQELQTLIIMNKPY